MKNDSIGDRMKDYLTKVVNRVGVIFDGEEPTLWPNGYQK